jgi:hypothetical protein
MPPDTGSRRRAVGPALAIVGIALGTCVMIASAAVGRGVERSIERTVEATLGRADFRISVPGGVVSDEILVTIGSVLGVEVAAPAVDHATTLVPEVDTTAPAAAPVTLLGIDPLLDGQVHDLDLVAGTSLARRDEAAAVITERLAADDGYGLGSDVIVATPGEPERFRVVGIVSGDGPFLGSGGRTVILPIDAVSRMFGLDGVARVDLLVEDEIPLAGVRSELGEALAGEPHLLTSPADFAEALRGSTTGFAVSAVVVAAVGLLFGALLAFTALWLTAPEQGEVGRQGRLRSATVPAAVGFGAGVVLASALGAVAGAAGILASMVGVALAVIASAGWPRDPSATRLTVALLTVGLGLVVALAMVAANARHTAVEPSIAAVVGPFVRQIDALAVLAAAVTALAIVGFVGLRAREWRPFEPAILGFAGALLGSILGLLVGATAIVLGGRSVDPSRDVPWGAIGLAFVLGIGLSTAAAWVSGALRGAPGDRPGGRVRMAASGRLGRRVEGARAGPAKGRNGCSSRRRD